MTGVTNYSDNGCISFRSASSTDLTLWLTSTSEWIRAIIHFPTYASSFLVKTIQKMLQRPRWLFKACKRFCCCYYAGEFGLECFSTPLIAIKETIS